MAYGTHFPSARTTAGRARIAALLLPCAIAVSSAAAPKKQDAVSKTTGDTTMQKYEVTADDLCRNWIVDGDAKLEKLGPSEVKISAIGPMALWNPTVFEGNVVVSFECLVPEKRTKLLLLAYGHGSDGTPIREWTRTGAYDGYNADRMEVYTLAFNRGPHITPRHGDQLANVRRIGGRDCAVYTGANFRKNHTPDRAFWNRWNTLTLLGAALEPNSGLGKYYSYTVRFEPPHIFMAVNDAVFAELVDHRPNPLHTGAIAFRCMSKGKAFILKNVVIEGTPAPEK